MKRRSASAFLAAALAFSAPAAAVDSPAEVEAALAVSDVRSDGGAIEARLTNRSRHELRDIRLLLEYVYHWPDELHPGDESPGRAWPHVVPGPFAPGASETLRFVPPAGLPSALGRFEPRVRVLGFTAVGE
jgi:hypothetical protein